MCARCHSLARVALQRRDEEEWRKLSNTHVGQWPSIEYSASGRDRPWFQIASGPLPAKLAALYPYSSAAWTAWQKHDPVDLAGAWVVVGHVPGGKDFYGTARIDHAAGGEWQASYALTRYRWGRLQRRLEGHRVHRLRMARQRRIGDSRRARSVCRLGGRQSHSGALVRCRSRRGGWGLVGGAGGRHCADIGGMAAGAAHRNRE